MLPPRRGQRHLCRTKPVRVLRRENYGSAIIARSGLHAGRGTRGVTGTTQTLHGGLHDLQRGNTQHLHDPEIRVHRLHQRDAENLPPGHC